MVWTPEGFVIAPDAGLGTPVPVPKDGSLAFPLAFAGLLVGLAGGLLTRPSVPLLGQLPIETVLTRGAALQGMDMLLKSTAEQSFNWVLTFVLVNTAFGAVLGALIGQLGPSAAARASANSAVGGISATDTVSAPDLAMNLTANPFCMMCGSKLPDLASFCPKCGTKRAS